MKRIFALLLTVTMIAVALTSCQGTYSSVPTGLPTLPDGEIIYSEIKNECLYVTYSGQPHKAVCIGDINNGKSILQYGITEDEIWVIYANEPTTKVTLGRISADYNWGSGGVRLTELVTEPPRKGDWSVYDFEGVKLTVLASDDKRLSREWKKDDIGDDDLDLAVANRNEVVAENLDIEVEHLFVPEANIANRVINDVAYRENKIDIVSNIGFSKMELIFRDCYANLLEHNADSGDVFPHLNFDLMCWNQSVVSNGSLNGQLYAVVGDINLSYFDSSAVIWHNRDLYDKIRDNKDPKDLIDTVIYGKWYYDDLYKWASYIGKGELEGKYGIYLNTSDSDENPTAAFASAYKRSVVAELGGGIHSFKNDLEDIISPFKKLCSLDSNVYGKDIACSFEEGDLLFKCGVIYSNDDENRRMREMEDKYSLLLWPKYDEDQEHYQTTCTGSFNTISVLSGAKSRGEVVSAYLQHACEYSYIHVRGYYFERIIKQIAPGVDDSDGGITKNVTTFVTIVDKLTFDIEDIYSPMLNGLGQIFEKAVADGKTVQEIYEADQDDYDYSIDLLDKWFGLVE